MAKKNEIKREAVKKAAGKKNAKKRGSVYFNRALHCTDFASLYGL